MTASSPFLPLCEPNIQGNEWAYVKECLDTAWVSSVGRFVDKFEQVAADYVGAKYAVAVVNGTAAIHAALVTVGVEPGDEVLCSDLTFVATANAIRHAGAHPVLVDAEEQHWQLDISLLEKFAEERCQPSEQGLRNRNTGRIIRAIVPVHVLGGAVDMSRLNKWASKWNVVVVEDAAEALGADYRGRRVGTMGTMGCFSFNGNKVITCGGGGIIVTDDLKLAERAKHLTTTAKVPGEEYVHTEIGFNYRLPNVLAAIGCAQMELLDQFVDAKRQTAARYREALGSLEGIKLWDAPAEVNATYWLHTIRVDAQRFGCSARQLMAHLANLNIQCRPLWQPMHLSPAHQACDSILNGVSTRLFDECLSIPSSVSLTSSQIDRVTAGIVSCAAEAGGRKAA
ncbi:MAG: LegC family aminotransferase [Pirellulaceae bacterium]|nr:LegC family aminotransferase [Planctomycetaceae bacterium]